MPLRVLFVDMNSFFASVEQQERPELRGRPIAVAAVDADSTCCIAASYEAKRLGVRTGTPVWQARGQGVRIVEARPPFYVRMHKKILAAVESCLPVQQVLSIDEMACRLDRREADPAVATALAKQVKQAIFKGPGQFMRCSIGLAPNRMLAKIASDMQKPDGLVVLEERDLPHALHRLELTDLPGIGPRMLRRLHSFGVTRMERFLALPEKGLEAIWGGVVGRRWWHWLRGADWAEPPTRRSTVGHSHVLPPELRTMEAARAVLIRLIHKAAVRLRALDCWAGRMEVYVSFTYREEGWAGSVALGQCQDTLTMLEAFNALWRHPPKGERPTQVAVTLYKLTPCGSAAMPLFPDERNRVALSHVMDAVNERFGAETLYFAGMFGMRKAAPTRIAFSHVPEIEDRFGPGDFNSAGS